MSNANLSEVARLREQIEQEYSAAQQALSGYAQVARHDFIDARMQRIETCRKALSTLVGEEKANLIMVQAVWPDEAE